MPRKASGIRVTYGCWGGIWRVKTAYFDPVEGKRKRLVEQVGSEAEARERAAYEQAQIDAGELQRLAEGPCPRTVGDLLDRLVQHYERRAADRTTRSGTVTYYRRGAAALKAHLGTTPLVSLAPDAPEKYAQTQLATGRKPGGVFADVRVLAAALTMAIERGWWAPPAGSTFKAMFRPVGLRKLGGHADICWLRSDEVPAFLRAAAAKRNPALWLVVNIGLRAGLRIEEILFLQWGDWRRQDRELFVCRERGEHRAKANKSRTVPVDTTLTAILTAEWKRQDEPGADRWMILGRTGCRLSNPRTATMQVSRLCQDAGVTRISAHGLRHTFATLGLQSGKFTLLQMKEVLGHASLDMTARYLHLDRRTLRDAADGLADFYGPIPAIEPAIRKRARLQVVK